jgi:hypothetical protein
MNKFAIDFVGVGPQRTGTTWLDRMLRAHPALCLPQDVKETMFFDRRYQKGKGWYAWHFRHCEEAGLSGEVAPTYFDSEEARIRLQAHNPAAKVIVTLRDPAERAFSLYLHHRRKGRVRGTFREAVARIPRIIEAGHYARHVPGWMKAFGRDHVHFVLLEDIKARPERTLERLYTFLGVSPAEASSAVAEEKVNAATMTRFPRLARAAAALATKLRARRLHRLVEWGKRLGLKRVFASGSEAKIPELSPDERQELTATYACDIAYVEEMLGRDLAGWSRAVNESSSER